MVLPYTIYSIYYQAFVAKKWCVLCTIIQLILWLEFFIGLNIGLEFRWEDLLKTANIMIMSFVFAPTIWALSKKTIEKSLKTDKLLIDNQKMIFDSDFIEVLLKRQKIMPPIFADMNLITIGRSDSKNIITLVMNPVCKKCGEAFNQIEKLLNDNNEFRCQMIFIATNFSDDEAGEFVRKLMSLSDGKKISALKGWFNLEHKSIKKWSKYFEANIETEDSIKQLDLQYKWCELANTRTSPILFLNSLEIPKMYNVNDLEKLIKFIHPVNQNLYYG